MNGRPSLRRASLTSCVPAKSAQTTGRFPELRSLSSSLGGSPPPPQQVLPCHTIIKNSPTPYRPRGINNFFIINFFFKSTPQKSKRFNPSSSKKNGRNPPFRIRFEIKLSLGIFLDKELGVSQRIFQIILKSFVYYLKFCASSNYNDRNLVDSQNYIRLN